MADAVNIKIEGMEKLNKLFDAYEKEATTAVMASLRKSAKVVLRAQQASLPAPVKNMKSVFKVVSIRKQLLVLAGVFSRGKWYINSRGIKWDPWSLIYWLNYGTYSGRMAGHSFIRPRKRGTSGRAGGIIGTGFMDAATQRALPQSQSEFEKDIEVRLDKILKKHAG